MSNPFLKDGYLTTTASINKLKVSDKNRYAIDMVSSEVFRKSGIEVLGSNLACLLSALKRGDEKDRSARKDWSEEHWLHWQRTEEILLAGGITSEPLGRELLRHMQHTFAELGHIPYKVTIPGHSHILSLIGAAKIAAGISEYKGSALVFDFGQSYVKRGFLQTVDMSDLPEKMQNIKILEKKEACHVQLDYEKDARSKEEAEKLDAFVQFVVLNGCSEMNLKALNQEPVIVLSIANYVHKGVIAGSRGGYGKLCLIADNYEDYLNARIGAALKMPIKIVLVHDGMAAAAMFNEPGRNYALLSLGTYMGVGFPSPVYSALPFPYTIVN